MNGRTPIEVHNGIKPRSPLQLAFYEGVELANADEMTIQTDLVEGYCQELGDAMAELHEELHDAAMRRYLKRLARAANKLPRLSVGDLVMVAIHGRRKHKNTFKWHGPFEVAAAQSRWVYKVRHIGDTGAGKPVHIQRIKRFSDNSLGQRAELSEMARRDTGLFTVHSLIGWREDGQGQLEIRVRWEGFEEDDDTWEAVDSLREDVPGLLNKFLRDRQHESVRLRDLLETLA